MRPPAFTLKYDPMEIPELAKQYLATFDDRDREMEDAGKRIVSGEFTFSNLEVICKWLSARNIHLLDRNPTKIKRALEHAISAMGVKEAVCSLTELDGIAVKRASAILAAMYPKRYTVMSIYSLESLGVKDSGSVYIYLHYLDFCLCVAEKYRITMRELDRANWQWWSKPKM
jgi:hypothetical protein